VTINNEEYAKKILEKLGFMPENSHYEKKTTDNIELISDKEYFEVEKAKLENKKLELDVDRLKEELDRYKKDSRSREDLKSKAFWIAICWLVFIVIIIFLQGIAIDDKEFEIFKGLSFNLDKVVISTLLGGTTVTVTSLLVIVIKGLFEKKEKDKI